MLMKKITALLLVIAISLSLAACGDILDSLAETSSYSSSESSKAESSKTESSKTESSKAESSKTESSKAESSKTESSKTESSKTESSKTESSKTESSKTESSKTESSKTESSKAESSKAESSKAESSKAESSKPSADSSFFIRFINVGQADAALIGCDGHYMLIDGGNKEDSNRIYTVLKNNNVPKLDIVVGTHAHEDHIGGLPGAFNYTTSDLTLCPVKNYDSDAFRDFVKYANQKGNGITIPSVGSKYSLGSAEITILGVNSANDPNNSSIVLKIQYGQTSFIFTGDAEREAEQTVLGRYSNLSADLLKVGHHGSDTSTTYPFLRAIMPDYAIISVGAGNSYGHPTDDALSRLRDAGVKIYRTDLNGDILVVSDGTSLKISTNKTATDAAIMTPGKNVSNSSKPTQNQTSQSSKPAQNSQPAQSSKPAASESSKPIGQEYILNTNSKKFHYPSCKSVKTMKESNKKHYTGTRGDLIAQGYDPCGNCHP